MGILKLKMSNAIACCNLHRIPCSVKVSKCEQLVKQYFKVNVVHFRVNVSEEGAHIYTFSGGLRWAWNVLFMMRKYMKKLQELNSVYRVQWLLYVRFLAFLTLFSLLVCTVLVCVITSQEVDTSDL